MKSIMSRYGVKNVNPQYFGSIDVATSGDSSSVQVCKKVGDTGYIYAPYIMAPTITKIDDWFETTEEKAERIREERKKKMDRIFKDNI